jgi:hypothetical protein
MLIEPFEIIELVETNQLVEIRSRQARPAGNRWLSLSKPASLSKPHGSRQARPAGNRWLSLSKPTCLSKLICLSKPTSPSKPGLDRLDQRMSYRETCVKKFARLNAEQLIML